MGYNEAAKRLAAFLILAELDPCWAGDTVRKMGHPRGRSMGEAVGLLMGLYGRRGDRGQEEG